MEQNLPFDLDALLVFGKVVECRSLSKAAALLGMPKSTVSRKLSKLESDLGIKLLRKNTHQLTVTDLGEKIYGHGVKILTEANGVRALVEGSKQEPQGELRVAMPVFVGIDYASRVGATFLQRYPQLAAGHSARSTTWSTRQGRIRRGVRNWAAAGLDADRAKGLQPRAVSLRITGLRAPTGGAHHHPDAIEHPAVHRLRRLRRTRASSRSRRHKRRYELSPMVRARANNFQVCKQYILHGLGIGAMPNQIICHRRNCAREASCPCCRTGASSGWTCT